MRPDRRIALCVVALCACASEPRESPASSPGSPAGSEAAPARASRSEPSSGDEPTAEVCAQAREGQPCEGSGYCVISWGEPGGWSSALWCRDGRWEIENERNLESPD